MLNLIMKITLYIFLVISFSTPIIEYFIKYIPNDRIKNIRNKGDSSFVIFLNILLIIVALLVISEQ